MSRTVANLALPLLLVALLYLLLSRNLLSSSPFVSTAQLLAIGVSIWARQSFRAAQFSVMAEPKAGPLLSTGPYRWIRHPMYASALLLLWASILGHFSAILVIVGLLVTGVIALRIVTEEQFLRASFPDYGIYAQKTKRLIPFLL